MGANSKTGKTNESSTKAKEFFKGDLAVYPAHGVGCIESIESKQINGDTLNFYMMKIVENGMVIMIPTSNVESVGLRDVIPETEVPEVYKVMQKKGQGARRFRRQMGQLPTLQTSVLYTSAAGSRRRRNQTCADRRKRGGKICPHDARSAEPDPEHLP